MRSVGSKHRYESTKGLIFGLAHIAPNFVDIDGYSNKKTEAGMLEDMAKAIAPYSKSEAEGLRDLIRFNEIVQTPADRNAGAAQYILEWEDVPTASRHVDENGVDTIISGKEWADTEYKNARWYVRLRIVK